MEAESKPKAVVEAPTTSNINAIDHSEGATEPAYGKQLDRNFSLLSICAVGLVVGNTWAALGGSIAHAKAVAIYNGGPPGVLYEFIAVSIFYWIIAACLAELASAIPSSGGVYHWASIVGGPKYGRIWGWYAGWWNFAAWIFGPTSISAIVGNCCVQMYAVTHPDFVPQKWHVFVCYLIVTWICCSVVLFANRALPAVNNLGLFLILVGLLITIIVCAVLPGKSGSGYASNDFVWREWSQGIGYSSNGFVFLMGMLNGAYAVGTPDCCSHLAEEIPRPEINVPKAIAAQMVIGFITAFVYMITIFYAITDLDSVLSGEATFPLAEIYLQATGTSGGTIGLLLLVMLPLICTAIGGYLTASRILWTLARDNATPFSSMLGKISDRWRNPFNAILLCGVIGTIFGCIYVGSSTAFNAFVGSFVILSTLSYLGALLPYVITRRKYIVPGPFWMKGNLGLAMHGIACIYIAVFVVIFCFPYALPVDAGSMNYSCLVSGGLTVFITCWWFWKGSRGYTGPQALTIEVQPVLGHVNGSVDGEEKV
ncbi:hypothetical protein MMC25_003055 [Agyrium rufum]|nr:hypothetical protein [Agyrium rufum]